MFGLVLLRKILIKINITYKNKLFFFSYIGPSNRKNNRNKSIENYN